MIKAIVIGTLITGTVAMVVGSQGSHGGVLYIHSFHLADYKMYWSWPVFLAGTGLFAGLGFLQR